jgi:hypothetical protein
VGAVADVCNPGDLFDLLRAFDPPQHAPAFTQLIGALPPLSHQPLTRAGRFRQPPNVAHLLCAFAVQEQQCQGAGYKVSFHPCALLTS